MNDHASAEPMPPAPIPADNPARKLTHVQPDTDDSLPHLGVVGDTYTILVSGQDTAGRYTLIDMHVPPGGGPPRPNRPCAASHATPDPSTVAPARLSFGAARIA